MTRPRAQGYGVALNDDWFRLAASAAAPVSIYTRDSLAPRADTAGSVEENVLELGYAFSRSNLTGGEGLDFFPRNSYEDERARDVIRFWDSKNIRIERPDAGKPYSLRLAYQTETWWAPATEIVDMGASALSLYVIDDNQTVYRFDDLADTTPEDTDALGVDLVQIAVCPSDCVAVLDSAGDIWFKAAKTDTYLKVYDHTTEGPIVPAVSVWSIKGRVLAFCDDPATADPGVLLEISPVITGTAAAPTEGTHTYTTIDTVYGKVWDVVDAGHAIVAAFSDGSLRSYVPQTDTAGGVPVLTIRARTNIPVGEAALRLAWNLGTLLFWTIDSNFDHLRLYQATVLDERFDYAVGQFQLVRSWEGASATVPAYTSAAVSTRDAIFFWVGETASTYHLWRYDLVAGGLVRWRADGYTTVPYGASLLDDTLVWVVSGDALREATTLMQEGYVITPNISFGLNTPINWSAFVLEANRLQELGTSVELWFSTSQTAILDPDDPSWVLALTLTDPVQSGQEHTRTNLTSNTLALMVKIKAQTGATAAAEVVRFAVRGFPQHRDWVVEVPINVSDYIEVPGRQPLHVPGVGDDTYQELMNLRGASVTLKLVSPPTVLRGMFADVATPIPYLTPRGSPGRYAMIHFRGTRISDTSGGTVSAGNAGIGVGTLGVSTMGMGEINT